MSEIRNEGITNSSSSYPCNLRESVANVSLLKPEWIAQAREKRSSAVIMNDGFGNRGAQPGHALRQTRRHSPAMQRQISDSGRLHEVIL
jgi:hypothetical protein